MTAGAGAPDGKVLPFRRVQGSIAELSDRALVSAVAEGDQAALGALFDRFQRDVHRFIARLVRGRDGAITLDLNAGGQGWFFDPTPSQDEEYKVVSGNLVAPATSASASRVDLLTAVMHEMGHLLGIQHARATTASDLMAETLAAGERKLPDYRALDALFARL